LEIQLSRGEEFIWPQTSTTMNNNINMVRTITGSMNGSNVFNYCLYFNFFRLGMIFSFLLWMYSLFHYYHQTFLIVPVEAEVEPFNWSACPPRAPYPIILVW
jgi:hypothetical protein